MVDHVCEAVEIVNPVFKFLGVFLLIFAIVIWLRWSGPWCLPGMCCNSKWKVRMETIHQLVLANGAMLGLLSMPLM